MNVALKGFDCLILWVGQCNNVHIKDSHINNLNMRNTVIKGNLTLSDTTVGDARLENAIIEGDLILKNTNIEIFWFAPNVRIRGKLITNESNIEDMQIKEEALF